MNIHINIKPGDRQSAAHEAIFVLPTWCNRGNLHKNNYYDHNVFFLRSLYLSMQNPCVCVLCSTNVNTFWFVSGILISDCSRTRLRQTSITLKVSASIELLNNDILETVLTVKPTTQYSFVLVVLLDLSK